MAEPIYAPSPADGPLLQGEILSDLRQVVLTLESIPLESDTVVDFVDHPLAIIVSQDCDLEQDFFARAGSSKPDKLLPSIMFCQMTTADEIFQLVKSAEIWRRIQQNNDVRYQFLERVPEDEDAIGKGLPELGVDFKRYFTLPTDEVYERLKHGSQRRCYLKGLYGQHICSRFHYYQSRVALPEDHHSE